MSSAKDFSCIGGLEKHIRVVKETVLFPLMYGDVYARFNLKPPRGLLFYGPPGTGKTLVASALAAECSNTERKVSFISRKGSDCLSKWVGESEKKLQKIFTLAQQSKPCIIFFDEVDGLAPVRSSRQDFVHASIVSTLLALMDGLENNSEIIVIGATNRIDAIDPALRRSGRFDRELYFPLPCFNARKEILSVEKQDFLRARQNIIPASHRVAVAPVKSLSWKIQPLLQNNLSRILSQLEILCPTGMLVCDVITGKAASRSTTCPRILLCGDDDAHTRHLGPALLHTLEHLPCHVLDVTTLFEETGRAAEEAIIQVNKRLLMIKLRTFMSFKYTKRIRIQKMKMARRSLPSMLYVPDILAWWELVDEAARVVFTSLMQNLDRSVHILILATANCSQENLPVDIASLFDEHQGEVLELLPPSEQQRESFFKQLFVHSLADMDSNQSSQDLEQFTTPKRSNVGRKRRTASRFDSVENPSPQDVSSSRKIKMESRTRSKVCTVRSIHLMSASKSKINVKRKTSGSGEGPPSKRSKNASPTNLSTSSSEKLTDSQTDELLRKITTMTEAWLCHDLESLFASLALTLEKNEEDMCTSVEECLEQFRELRQMKINVKKEQGED